uniref:tryptophan synthase alpha subunit n=1 Tax=Rhodospora sordida TaxID=362230 RepID=UPI001FCCEA2C|nr:tryptophan synthase alpha subunit [Rhodospora sordida]UNJ15008.1 tryptophan synthase alpha subunit [Rhodospora sordida]
MISNVSIAATFSRLKNQCALIPFITAGDPKLSVTKKALKILSEEGADIIELGIPYSDPLADGPVIQAASFRALQNAITLNNILDMVYQITQEISTPLVAFAYYNLVINSGISSFIDKIKAAGFAGLLVPDLPLEEINILEDTCKKSNVELILLIGPNTSEDRVKKIVRRSQGCVYLVSNTGVTGMQFGINSRTRTLIKVIQNYTQIALIVGFGISTREDIQLVQSWEVDGIVMGSSFVKKLFESSSDPELQNFKDYCRYVKHSLSG